jgi:uncharacterized MAPEG superfamily protein
MTRANWCILIALLLPYLWVGVAKAARGGAGRYDNAAPRDYLGRVRGLPARANWAHLNAFEAFAPFAAAVLVAEKAGADQASIDMLALAFIGARLLHGALYLADKAALRTLAWLAGMACVIGLFVIAA